MNNKWSNFIVQQQSHKQSYVISEQQRLSYMILFDFRLFWEKQMAHVQNKLSMEAGGEGTNLNIDMKQQFPPTNVTLFGYKINHNLFCPWDHEMM